MSIYLKLFYVTLSKLFNICFGWDLLSLTDTSACPNLLLYQDTSLLTSPKYAKVLFFHYWADSGLSPINDVRRWARKKGPQGFIKNPLVLLFSGLFSFHSPFFLYFVLFNDVGVKRYFAPN